MFSRDNKDSCGSVWYPHRSVRIHSAVRVSSALVRRKLYDSHLQERSESVEEPAMTVDLLLILLLHTEDSDDLRGHDPLVRMFVVQVRVEREGRCILEQMRSDWFTIDNISHVTAGLVGAKKSQTVEDARMYFPATVGDNA